MNNFKDKLIAGLWDRLSRHGRSDRRCRAFIVYELTRILSGGDL